MTDSAEKNSAEIPDEASPRLLVHVCQGTGCVSSKSPAITEALRKEVEKAGLASEIEVKLTGCHGFCQQGPIVVIEPEGVFYRGVTVEDAPDIVEKHLKAGERVERLFYHDPETGEPVPLYHDIEFYRSQKRVILRNCGIINPEVIDEYTATGGYEGAKKAVTSMSPEDVITEVKKSGLRGRGGAGFPAAVKWDFCRRADGDRKYVICNADEGDPGAFMDRTILEADPNSVIEGLTILAYAVGASTGYIYCRAEYPLAVERVKIALRQAREKGFLGSKIFGAGFDFDIEIFEGAGAFVCGEETALIASIEGERGQPRCRPPFPAVKGLWGEPTIINNVKTLAAVPVIITRGAEWFASTGTEGSPGTAVFALTGKISNSGLVEVEMGTPLDTVINRIGGGVPDGKRFKAVQTGGPSGGCLPAELLDLPVDFDTLTKAGSMMGSGGMVVADETTCMIDLARYFMEFCKAESCGKCTPCREGTHRMWEILVKITEGNGTREDLDTLASLAEFVKGSSLCALGQTAPNPVLSTMRYFADEYAAHVDEKRCPAASCRALITFTISAEACIGCTKCAKNCPVECIAGEPKMPHEIDQEKCIRCGTCLAACPVGAISVK